MDVFQPIRQDESCQTIDVDSQVCFAGENGNRVDVAPKQVLSYQRRGYGNALMTCPAKDSFQPLQEENAAAAAGVEQGFKPRLAIADRVENPVRQPGRGVVLAKSVPDGSRENSVVRFPKQVCGDV